MILVICYYNLSVFYIYVYVHMNTPRRVVCEVFLEANIEIRFCSVTSESSHRAWKLLKMPILQNEI